MEPYCYKCQKNASCNDPQCPNQAYHYQKEGEEKRKRRAEEAKKNIETPAEKKYKSAMRRWLLK